MLSSMLSALFMLPPEKLFREEANNGLVVSTIYASDAGYETAIGSESKATFWPVERYATHELAEDGHKRWVEKLPSLTHVTKLGHPDYGVEDIVLELSELLD